MLSVPWQREPSQRTPVCGSCCLSQPCRAFLRVWTAGDGATGTSGETYRVELRQLVEGPVGEKYRVLALNICPGALRKRTRSSSTHTLLPDCVLSVALATSRAGDRALEAEMMAEERELGTAS